MRSVKTFSDGDGSLLTRDRLHGQGRIWQVESESLFVRFPSATVSLLTSSGLSTMLF